MSKLWLQVVEEPTVISTFAGCGGSSLGYKMAGYKELLAIDFDKNSVETFALNFPDVLVWQKDIKEVTGQEILKFCEIEKGELDVLDGSPPCQGFSTAGKRNVNDSRNDLFKEYCRILKELQPKVFVMENVSGMIKGKMKGMFIEIMKELKSCGYNVKCKLMNAMWYDVPQSRERLIFIGVRNDLNIVPVFPKAKEELISASKAIQYADISNIGQPKGLLAEKMKSVKAGSNIARTFKESSLFSYVRCPINKPSMTLQKSVTYGGISMYHPYQNRNLSIGELKRICSFSDNFKLSGSYIDAVNRLGNSVPPKMMQAIAECIKVNIINRLDVGIDNKCHKNMING